MHIYLCKSFSFCNFLFLGSIKVYCSKPPSPDKKKKILTINPLFNTPLFIDKVLNTKTLQFLDSEELKAGGPVTAAK